MGSFLAAGLRTGLARDCHSHDVDDYSRLQAEFPSSSLESCFAVFNVAGASMTDLATTEKQVMQLLKFGLRARQEDSLAARREFMSSLHRLVSTKHEDNRNAWAQERLTVVEAASCGIHSSPSTSASRTALETLSEGMRLGRKSYRTTQAHWRKPVPPIRTF